MRSQKQNSITGGTHFYQNSKNLQIRKFFIGFLAYKNLPDCFYHIFTDREIAQNQEKQEHYQKLIQMFGQNLMKNFVIENEVTQETKIVQKCLVVNNGLIDIMGVLEQLGSPYGKIYKIYSQHEGAYRLLSDYCSNWSHPFVFPAALFQPEIILIKYERDRTETESMNSGTIKSQTSSVKKQRSKERSIAEVIEIVKYWRQLHTNVIKGKKMNLQEAAQLVGISKKSLDDYYYQLRLGEKYDFDFKKHLYEKVGTLRNFIKDIKRKHKSQRIKMDKHPKSLKIIEEFATVSTKSTSIGNKCENEDENFQRGDRSVKSYIKRQGEFDMDDEANEDRKSLQSIEDQFYNDFEFFEEEPIDPFLNFQGNFKKREQNQALQQLFF